MADEMNFDEQLQHSCKAQCQTFLFSVSLLFPLQSGTLFLFVPLLLEEYYLS